MLAPSPYGPAFLSPRTRWTVTPKTTECGSHRDLTGLTGLSTPIAYLGKLRLKGKRNLSQSHSAPLDRAKTERDAAYSLSSSSHAAPHPQRDEALCLFPNNSLCALHPVMVSSLPFSCVRLFGAPGVVYRRRGIIELSGNSSGLWL